jgi:hypothetical protein
LPFEPTARRLWRHLGPDDRRAAAASFFREPTAETAALAVTAIAKARHMRPQAARVLAPEAQASALASILDPGETLASALLVSLHLGERRALLTAFLDAVGLPHEDGILKEDEASPAPLGEEEARRGARAIAAAFPRAQVELYLNVLWLQEPERWAVLRDSSEWLSAPSSSSSEGRRSQ